jgi:hypothetical protein
MLVHMLEVYHGADGGGAAALESTSRILEGERGLRGSIGPRRGIGWSRRDTDNFSVCAILNSPRSGLRFNVGMGYLG